MALPVTFVARTQSTGAQLDQNFNATGNMGLFPCAITGTNAIVLTPTSGITPTVSAYADYMRFCGAVATTNSSAMTARVGALAILAVYKDSPLGPVACTGGEAIAGNMITLIYDSALAAGAGGFHLISNTSYAGGTLAGSLGITTSNLTATTLNVGSLGSLTQLMVGASAATVARVLSAVSSLSWSALVPSSSALATIAVPGAQLGDVVALGLPAVSLGINFGANVLAAGSVGVRANNLTTGSTITPTAGNHRVMVTGFS